MKIENRKRSGLQNFFHYSAYVLGLTVAFSAGYMARGSLPEKLKDFDRIEYYINHPYESFGKVREKFEKDSVENKKSIDSSVLKE